ncbi:MAG: hypothetical protein QOF29_1929, partial [bacterium]
MVNTTTDLESGGPPAPAGAGG